MIAYTYPLADLFGTMLGIFVFLIWFWLLVIIFGDIFRSKDMSGGVKALWVLFVIILPFLGILVYLIARGGKMHERAEQAAQQQQQAFDAYVKETAGGGNSVDQLAKLADLKQQGAITDAEFEAQKAKILS
jgi:ABC-type multidrug transport system fused ATPase/permease subunit